MYWRTLCFECYKKEPQRGMKEEDCLHLFPLIEMCFLLLSVYFQVQVVTACRSSGGNSGSFDNSNVCYLSFVSFRFCCIVHCSCSFPSLFLERSLYRFSALCLPICLQRPVTQISDLALFLLSSPLSLSRDPYVGSLRLSTEMSFLYLSLCRFSAVSPSVFRDLLLRSLLLLFSSLPPSLSLSR